MRASDGAVDASSASRNSKACSRLDPHISALGCRSEQTGGRRGSPNRRQRDCASSCTHRTPAGLPSGMPGIADDIDGAMQQAPQATRQRSWPARPVGAMCGAGGEGVWRGVISGEAETVEHLVRHRPAGHPAAQLAGKACRGHVWRGRRGCLVGCHVELLLKAAGRRVGCEPGRLGVLLAFCFDSGPRWRYGQGPLASIR